MPTTQRLLTDETGQALVTAINNIVAAVKPNATEIQMGANDTTTVAEAINSTNQALANIHHLDRSSDADALHDTAGANTIYQSVLFANASNAPSTNACWISGFKISDGYGFQRAVDTVTGIEYTRYRWGGGWQAWYSLKSEIEPTGYQSSDISYSGTYGSYISGGYFMIGNLVVLNIIVSATESRASTTKMFELPSSAKPRQTIALTAVNSVDDLPPQYSIITNTGGMFIKNIVAGKSYTISGCWLKS